MRNLWIYEYKDEETLIGSTFFEGSYEEFLKKMPFQLPKLQQDWAWKIEDPGDLDLND